MGHLIIQRDVHEGVWIGDDIRVEIVSVSGGHVRLSIVAPDDVRILRDEIRPDRSREHERRQMLVPPQEDRQPEIFP